MLGLKIGDMVYPFLISDGLNPELLTITVPLPKAKNVLRELNEVYLTGDKSIRQQLKAGLAVGLASKVTVVKDQYCNNSNMEPDKILLSSKIIFKNLLKNFYDIPAEIIDNVAEGAMLLTEHRFGNILDRNTNTLDVVMEGPLSLILSRDDLGSVRKSKKYLMLGYFSINRLFSVLENDSYDNYSI